MSRLDAIRSKALAFPPVRQAVRAWHRRRFSQRPGMFDGVFPDFASALLAIPEDKRGGFDLAPMAGLYRERLGNVFACDYPVLFWLRPLLRPGLRVFDVGGHVGVTYYAYQRYLAWEAPLSWTVQDVPAVVRAGRELAATRTASELSFTEDLRQGDGHDVLIAGGSLQFIEPGLAQVLAGFARPPPHLFLHKLPLTDGPAYVTLQNTIHSYNPYHVFNRADFVRSFEALGYSLVDSWADAERSVALAYDPARSVPAYSGLYLRAAGTDRAPASTFQP